MFGTFGTFVWRKIANPPEEKTSKFGFTGRGKRDSVARVPVYRRGPALAGTAWPNMAPVGPAVRSLVPTPGVS